MEKKTMDDFYAIADENDFIRNLKAVNELAMRIPSHRAEKCQASLTDYAPFKRSKLYLETSVLFFDYQEDNNNFKLDLNFFEDGRAEAVFWNPGKRDEEGTQALKRKVQKIRFEENIKLDGTVFRKRFDLGDYPNMNSIDTAIYEFAKGLFAALQLN